MKFIEAVRNASKKMEADFEDSKLFTHSGDKGEFREQIIEKFLKPFLPECYSIGSGQVFDSFGESSNQIDIAIFDSMFSSVLFKEYSNKLFPCETIYGTIEVKSNLDTKELKTSCENVISLKKLIREDSDMLDILPFRGIPISKDPSNAITYSKLIRNPYLGFVFAYDGLLKETAIEKLNEFIIEKGTDFDKNSMPDYIFNWKKGYMITKGEIRKDGLWISSFDRKFDKYFGVDLGDDIIPFFFLTLNITLNQILLKAPDYNKYWKEMFQESIKNNNEKILKTQQSTQF